MASSLKKLFKSAKAVKAAVQEESSDAKRCECGDAVAMDLGQSDVCAKHIRAS